MKKWDSSGPLIGWLADVARFTVFCPNYLVTSNSKMWMFDGFSAYFGKFRIRLSIPIFWGGFCTLPHSIFLLFPPCLFSLLFFLFSSLLFSLLYSLSLTKTFSPLPLLSSLPLFTICQCDMFLVCWRQEGVKRQTDTNTQTHTHSQLLLSIHQSKSLHELWRILWTTSDLCTHLLIYERERERER